MLQEWNWSKKLERLFKIHFKRLDGDGLSAVEPQQYVRRFMRRAVLDVFEGADSAGDVLLAQEKVAQGGGKKAVGAGGRIRESKIERMTRSVKASVADGSFQSSTSTDLRFSAVPLA